MTETTPLNLLKMASVHQKHPPAKVAISRGGIIIYSLDR